MYQNIQQTAAHYDAHTLTPPDDRSATIMQVGTRRYRVTWQGRSRIVHGSLGAALRLTRYLGLEPVTVL